MTIAAFRGTCPTCGFDHDAHNREFRKALIAVKVMDTIKLAELMSHSNDDDKRRLAREVLRLSTTEAQAQARIAELEKAIVGECDDCGHTIITPLHPLPSVEQDAARYRFLRDNVRAHDRMVGYCIRAWTFDAPCDIATLDAAIDDAALKSRA